MYQQDRLWRWQICPHTLVLFHYDAQKWWAYLPAQRYPTHVGYRNRCSVTTKPINTFPVTPILFEFKIHVPLPVSPIDIAPQMPPDI